MNTMISSKRALNIQRVRHVLTMNGMAISTHGHRNNEHPLLIQTMSSTTVQQYIVLVYDLEVLSVYRRQIGALARYEIINLQDSNRALTSLYRKAIRAVYCLGLDYAAVTLEKIQGDVDYAILKVDPEPSLTTAQKTLVTEAMIRAQQLDSDEQQMNKQALIGMDPEFMLCRADGKIVSAAQYLQRNGRAGYDGIRVKGKVVYPFVELRPKPSIEPRQLMIHLMQAMLDAAGQINNPDLTWLAGGMPKKGFRLGGHIHLSQIRLTSRLLRALDNYLALPLILIEAESAQGRRPRYGFLGDFRHQFHGGFEYRTLPSWIVTPRIAKGVIALARLIADHYRQLTQHPLADERVQGYFYKAEKEPLIAIVQRLWLDLEKTSSYARYASYLNPLKQQLFLLKAWEETDDLRRHWKIRPYDI